MRDLVVLVLCWIVLGLRVASAAPAAPYAFPASSARAADDLAARIAVPAAAERVVLEEGTFGAWLRHLPLLPVGAPVLLYDGQMKGRQDVHAAVVDLDVPRRDLQQCADAVMRLRAEYLYGVGRPGEIQFHPDPGKQRVLKWTGGGVRGEAERAAFMRYLTRVFSEAGSASLQAELGPVPGGAPVQPGDVLIQGGYPGHAVLVLDVAQGGGRRYLLLGQSYMPAQQFHVLKNLADRALSPWFDAALLEGAGLATPEWRPFRRRDVRRFP